MTSSGLLGYQMTQEMEFTRAAIYARSTGNLELAVSYLEALADFKGIKIQPRPLVLSKGLRDSLKALDSHYQKLWRTIAGGSRASIIDVRKTMRGPMVKIVS